jgi:hypothetical protein
MPLWFGAILAKYSDNFTFTFWDMMLCSPLEAHRNVCVLSPTTRSYILEDDNLHSHSQVQPAYIFLSKQNLKWWYET